MEANTLKGYAQFLLANHLDEMAALSLQRAREVQLPLLALFNRYTETELLALFRQSLQTFLTDLSAGVAFQAHLVSLQRWKADLLPEVPSSSVDARDLAFSPHTRKFALYQLLGRFTRDVDRYQAITQEIEAYYSDCQASSLEAFMEVQNRAIQQEKDFLQMVIDHTEDGISAYDQQGRMMLWNQALEQRTGISRQQVLGRSPFDLFPGYRESEDGLAVARVLKGEKIRFQDRPFQGREGYYEALLLPLTNDQQKVFGGLTISRDITQRKKNEEQLRQQRHFIQQIAAATPDAIVLVSVPEIKTIYSNREITALLGYSPDQAQQMSPAEFSALIHPDDLPLRASYFRDFASAENDGNREMEYRIKDSKGEWRWFAVRGKVFDRYADGTPSQVITISQDITRRKESQQEVEKANQELLAALEELRSSQEQLVELNNQLEQRVQKRTEELQASLEELTASNEELRSTNEELTQTRSLLEDVNSELNDRNAQLLRINTDLDNFVYTASHDLKSPVTNLDGLMGVLHRKIGSRLEASEGKVMELMGNSILKLKATIGGLIEITKASKSQEEIEMVSFPRIVEEVKEELSELIRSTHALIKEDYQVPKVRFAPAHVRSVVYNLLSNAIKYCSPERKLEVGILTYQEGMFAVLCVVDNGLGMTEAQQAKLFTMFRRMHTHVEGTGIGLYIIKRVMTNHGGKIEVESQPGQGSQFKVYFPVSG